MYNIRSDTIRWQIPDFLSDGISALYLTVYVIFANYEKIKKNYLEDEGQDQGVEERDLRHSTEMFKSI